MRRAGYHDRRKGLAVGGDVVGLDARGGDGQRRVEVEGGLIIPGIDGLRTGDHRESGGELGGITALIGRRSAYDLAGRDDGREAHLEARVTVAIGRHGGLAKEGLALAKARWIGCDVGEELDGEAGTGSAVERA